MTNAFTIPAKSAVLDKNMTRKPAKYHQNFPQIALKGSRPNGAKGKK